MSDVEAIIRNADQHCKKHGARLTVKRKQVLAGLLKSNKALSAYDLVDFFKKEYDEIIPAMSIYRILEFLEEMHLVHKLNLANKYVACAHISCDHVHGVSQFFICGNCSKVKEVNIKRSMINDMHTTAQEAGFKLTSPQLELNCLCEECDAKSN